MSSIRIEATRRFPVTVERGFAFITDSANWSAFWPGFVRQAPGSAWQTPGDKARLVTRLMGRDRELAMTLVASEPNRVVRYTSSQAGLPDAYHEREFLPDGDAFLYRLVVEYTPRRGLAGLFDRTILRRSVRRAFDRTFAALEREFRGLERSP
jgi:uncharacterized protein YndB with AHSA1/START domain